jgi:hypothetical protein
VIDWRVIFPLPSGRGRVPCFDPARYPCLERREADSTRSRNSLPAPSGLLTGYSAAAGVATPRVRSLIVDVFPHEAGRQAHLSGLVRKFAHVCGVRIHVPLRRRQARVRNRRGRLRLVRRRRAEVDRQRARCDRTRERRPLSCGAPSRAASSGGPTRTRRIRAAARLTVRVPSVGWVRLANRPASSGLRGHCAFISVAIRRGRSRSAPGRPRPSSADRAEIDLVAVEITIRRATGSRAWGS